ncbi:hypothetical protein BDA99DRAFT_567282 [Phascolomyces articulosus]|uniref:Uncharacterized protein n=1 Tax=Phascolomyces articulosus TaxID=60185 RepID=A0AAD5KRW3_9FUNG|nr:hypothetical protein BDA99DRAFT_567282 [Phascolomyces articulosus]
MVKHSNFDIKSYRFHFVSHDTHFNTAHIIAFDLNVNFVPLMIAYFVPSRFFSVNNLRMALPEGVVTTRANTGIDEFFTSFLASVVVTGTYVNASASFHRPLYLRLG